MKSNAHPAKSWLGADGSVRMGHGKREASVLFSGDLCPINGYADCFAAGRVEELMSEVLPVAYASDVHIANLELALTRRGRPIPKCGPNFRADPDAVRGLRQLKITHACLANNHIRDYGDQGIRDTVKALSGKGIQPVGIVSGHNATMSPLFFRRKGVKFCLLNVAEAEFAYPTEGHLGASWLDEPGAMEVLRRSAPRADVTIVVFHGGREFQYLPPVWMQHMCRRFVSCGANIVVSHHAHVPQGVEILPGGVICYSLGNFVFDFGSHAAFAGAVLGYLLRCGVNSRGLVDVTIIPTLKREDLSVTLLSRAARAEFFRFLEAVSRPFADDGQALGLWKEYVRRDAPLYLPALRAHASALAEDGMSAPEYDAMILYAYLAGCRTHREVTSAAARLLFEKEMRSVPRDARTIRKWETMVDRVLAARPAKTA